MTKDKLLLIDADQLWYQYTSAHEHEVSFDSRVHEDAWLVEADTYLVSNVKAAEKSILEALGYLIDTGDYKRSILCFTSTPNFRHNCLPTYKGGRVKKRKPVGYWTLVEKFLAAEEWETRKIPGLEADDVMSIMATNPLYKSVYDIHIWSQDKDMLQVPNVTLHRDNATEVMQTQAEADRYRWTQALTGDTTDGYKGLKGYGPAKVAKLFDGLGAYTEADYFDQVMDTYIGEGMSRADALAQINCALILRTGEYDFNNKQPILRT